MRRLFEQWRLVIKLFVSVSFLTVLFSRLVDFSAFSIGIQFILSNGILFFTASFLLIFLNWGIEALKWKELLKGVFPAKITDTIRYVLTGVTLGFITPGRSGEFVGRMLLMPEKIRMESLLLAVVGGIAQIIPIVAFALIVSAFSVFHFISTQADIAILSFLLLLFLSGYFFSKELVKISFLRRLIYRISINPEVAPPMSSLLKVLLLSTFRFLVFSLQYMLLLHAAGISFQESIAPVCWMLLLQSFSPAVAFLDIGVRGSIAYFVFTKFGLYNELIISAVFLVWFINLCIPALAGYWLILRWEKTTNVTH